MKTMQAKLEDYRATGAVAQLVEELAKHRQTEIGLRQDVAVLQTENKDQGMKLEKLAVGTEFRKQIKILMEDLRVAKSKNETLEE